MTIIDYNKEVAINILEKTYNTVELEEEDVKIIDNVEMQVISKDTQYWVECYYTGDHDIYVLRIYNRNNSKDTNITDEGLLSVTDLDSCGNVNYVTLYEDIDTEVEQAIMDVLFAGDKPLIIPF